MHDDEGAGFNGEEERGNRVTHNEAEVMHDDEGAGFNGEEERGNRVVN
jgi:hypothetical protein